MATAFPLPVAAAQVGTYFVGQYYQMLQTQPDSVHQFYSNSSTMLRVYGNTRDTATAMLQIHQLIMSLGYSGIEIKTAHSLESWSGGVLVMVSGSVLVKSFNGRKKFVETFFLAPQEKGYFVLNDIFHYVDEEQIIPHPFGYLTHKSLHSPVTVQERETNPIRISIQSNVTAQRCQPVPRYTIGGDIQSRDFSSPAKIEDDSLNKYNHPEEQVQQVPEAKKILEDNYSVLSNGSLEETMNSVPDHFSSPTDEPAEEPQKHTYASIVAKRQPIQSVHSQPSLNKPAPQEGQSVSETPSQPLVAQSDQIELSGIETLEDTSAMEDEVEVKSVYVRNVPTTMDASVIGEALKKFGKLRPDGVAIRTRKDMGVCYAFVEFEDISGVQNAIKASVVQIGSHQLFIEGRRPNRNNSIRGGRGRGIRGRVGYQMDGARGGRFGGRCFVRANSNHDGQVEHYYSRPRANNNGFYKQSPARNY